MTKETSSLEREIEDALTRMPIRVLDEEWRDVLPGWYRHLLVEAPAPAAQPP